MVRDTQRKGDIAKAQAILHFTSLGYEVAVLLTESAPYDLIIDDGELHRAQVKFTSSAEVDLRRIHSNSTGYVVKAYNEFDFDWLVVYNPDKGIFVIKDAAGKKYTSLNGRVPESGLLERS